MNRLLWAGAAAILVLGSFALWRQHQPGTGSFSVDAAADPPPVALRHDDFGHADHPWADRAMYGHRLEPAENVILHGAGQSDGTSFAHYTQAVAPARPMLSMSYVDLHDDIPAYFARVRADLEKYPELIVPQIGVSMNAGKAATHYEQQVADGVDDRHVHALCEGLASLDRPVFLRVGYEFNGAWNGYQPQSYVQAYRHVAETIRGCGLNNVAMVWDVSIEAELDAEHAGAAIAGAPQRWAAFYPGDAWVDWWAFNALRSETLTAPATRLFLEDAARRRFPVMIAEATPNGHSVATGQAAVEGWFAPFFDLLRSSPGIKAFCYIDWDWSAYPQWATWGDARIERDPRVLAFYRRQVSAPLFADARGRDDTLRLLRVPYVAIH